MNKMNKTTLWTRIRNAARALRGKPASSLTFGIKVIRCDECERMADEGWIDGLDLLHDLEEWRTKITPDHRDPLVEAETLELVEDMIHKRLRRKETLNQ